MLNTTTKLFFMNIKVRIIFVLTTFQCGFLCSWSLHPSRLSSCANSVLCVPSSRAADVVTSAASCNSAYSSRVAGDVGSRSVHAAAFDATYQSPPTIVGSDLGAGNYFILCVDGHPFFAQPSLWRNVLRLAHSSRRVGAYLGALNGTFVDCCGTLLCRRSHRTHKSQRFMSQPQH